jgi:hypothetical protein
MAPALANVSTQSSSGPQKFLGRRPLYPQKRTLVSAIGMSALCQKSGHSALQYLRLWRPVALGATLDRKDHSYLTYFHASSKGSNLIVETGWGIVKVPRRRFLHLAAGATALPALRRVRA